MDSIQLREATLDDVIGIVYVHATATIDAYPNPDYGITTSDVKEIDFHPMVPQWQHALQSPNYRLWVQAKDKEIVGFIAVRKDGDSQEIYAIYVLPDHQRQGLGRGLMKAALDWLDSTQPVKLRLLSYLSKAIDFFKEFNFRVDPTAELGNWRTPTGRTAPTVEMTTGEVVSTPKPEPVAPHEPEATVKTKEKAAARPPVAKPQKQLIGRNELARLSGLRASTIKHYTEIGLLPFVQKEARLARRYRRSPALRRLEEIQALKNQGLSIAEIQQHLKG